jgi:hypothetical protein
MSFDFDFNNAEQSTGFGELIPDGTVAPVQMNIKPGNVGDGGWATQSKTSAAVLLSCEFTVVLGPFFKRKFWRTFTIDGNTEGHKVAVEISKSQIRAIIEAIRGIDPTDEGEEARKARRLAGWQDLDGARFMARIGIEKGKGDYQDRNTLKSAIPSTSPQYQKLEQLGSSRVPGCDVPGRSGNAGAAPVPRPTAW